MLFNQINIYGWDDIEPLILAAIVSDLPVLLIGDIGSNKTEGSEAISRALLGAKINFRAYEVPTLNFDDLIGFMNPKSLARGELDFVHTPLSSGRPMRFCSMKSTAPTLSNTFQSSSCSKH